MVHVGKVITKATGSVGKVLDGISIYDGYKQDRNQIGYNTVRAVADVAGGWAGAVAGLKIGTSIGSLFGGVGAIPGAVIGSTVLALLERMVVVTIDGVGIPRRLALLTPS